MGSKTRHRQTREGPVVTADRDTAQRPLGGVV